MTTPTLEETRKELRNYLSAHDLPAGLGTEESACSVAAINLVLSGKLTDKIPDCMSGVLGAAILDLQDAMPDELRNSARYKAWLPSAIGTGSDNEEERLNVLLDWMWGTVLPQLQWWAYKKKFGDEWRIMCDERSAEPSSVAANAACDAPCSACHAVAYSAAKAADYTSAGDILAASNLALRVVCKTAYTVGHATRVSTYAGTNIELDTAAGRARARGVATAASDAARLNFWCTVDPIGVLEKMTNVGKT